MFGHHHHREEEEAYNTMLGDNFNYQEHDGNTLHELLAGAASFAAMRAYENRRAAEGHHDHALAREMLAAIAGAEVDKLAETKGMDWADRERAKRRAVEKAHIMYDRQYVSPGLPGGFEGGAPGYGGYERREGMAGGYGGSYEQQAAGYASGGYGGAPMPGGGYGGEGYGGRGQGYGMQGGGYGGGGYAGGY